MKKFNGKSGQVDAGKITDITPVEKDLIIDGGGRVSHSHEWQRQNNPQIGDYYVIDDKGNASIMGAGDFKDEFEIVADRTIPTGRDAEENRSARDKRADEAAGREVPREQKAADNLRKAQEEKAEKASEDARNVHDRQARSLSTPQAVQAKENAAREAREAGLKVVDG